MGSRHGVVLFLYSIDAKKDSIIYLILKLDSVIFLKLHQFKTYNSLYLIKCWAVV
jgi:hypothetical protein